MNRHSRSIRFRFGEYDGRYNRSIPRVFASACTVALRWYLALSSTTVTAPCNFCPAIARNNAHIASVFTTAVLVTVVSVFVTAFHAPKTLNRWRPDAARTNTRVNDHKQPRNVPKTKWAASTKNTWP